MRLFALLWLVGACGDNRGEACVADSNVRVASASRGCLAALRFAAREASALLPHQTEADRFFERWSRVIDMEPILADRVPQLYRAGPGGGPSWEIYTTNPQIIAAWRDGILTTGDLELDTALAALRGTLPWPARVFGAGYRATLNFEVTFNEDLLADTFAARASEPPEKVQYQRDDGVWTWSDDMTTAQVEFRFGWGDCFVACEGFRYLRAVVLVTGEATVYDLGGDTLPPGLMLSPMTRPAL